MTDICNIEIEQQLLGNLLMNNEAFGLISGKLLPQHFFERIHQQIYDNASKMIRAGKVANPSTIKSYLPENDKIGNMTVSQYLARLAAEAMGIMLVPTHANEIYDFFVDRTLISTAEDLIKSVRNREPNVSPKEIGEQAIADISSALSDEDTVYGATSFGEALDDALAATSQAYSGKKPVGVSYRLPPLERLIGPLCGGQLIILGAATKQGKSALAGQIAMGAATEGFPVWIYSGEMSAMELAMRESSRETKISVKRQKRGKVQEADYERMMQFRNAHRDKPLYIQTKRLTLELLAERAKAFVQKKGKGPIFVDHIGLIERGRGEKNMSNWEFGEVATGRLKLLAQELDCPVVACVQLKKNTFNDFTGPITEKSLRAIIARKPKYTDLIGAVERDADHVICPHRCVVFLKENEPPTGTELHGIWELMVDEQKDRAKLVLALSREENWPMEVECGWEGFTTTFYEVGSMRETEIVREMANPMALR